MTDKPEEKRRTGGNLPGAATIYDVAKRAGVSPMTVSRVVNADVKVRPATRDAVQKAMRELQFRPNKAARSLAGREEFRVGLLYNNPSTTYFTELLMGALEGSARNGVQLVVDKCKIGDLEAAAAAVRKLVDGGISGMVLTAPISEDAALIKELTNRGISTVAVALGTYRGDVTCVGIDDVRASYEQTKYLASLGHKRLGFIKGHPAHSSAKQRFLGFEAAVRDLGNSIEKPRIAQGYYTFRSGLEAAEELLSGRQPPTAIFASNDDMASGVLLVAHRMGLNVPHDLSVAGFDDTIAGSLWPALTTIRQPINDIASKMIDVIVQNLREIRAGRTPACVNHVVPHLLVVRESTSPVQSRSRF